MKRTVISMLCVGVAACATSAQKQAVAIDAATLAAKAQFDRCVVSYAVVHPERAAVYAGIIWREDGPPPIAYIDNAALLSAEASETFWDAFLHDARCFEAYIAEYDAISARHAAALRDVQQLTFRVATALAGGEITIGRANALIVDLKHSAARAYRAADADLADELEAAHRAERERAKAAWGRIIESAGGLAGGYDASAPASGTQPGRRGQTCLKRSESKSGLGKICYYNCAGTARALNLASYEACPAIHEF